MSSVTIYAEAGGSGRREEIVARVTCVPYHAKRGLEQVSNRHIVVENAAILLGIICGCLWCRDKAERFQQKPCGLEYLLCGLLKNTEPRTVVSTIILATREAEVGLRVNSHPRLLYLEQKISSADPWPNLDLTILSLIQGHY